MYYYMTKPLHLLLSHYTSTKSGEGIGRLFLLLANRRGAYSKGERGRVNSRIYGK